MSRMMRHIPGLVLLQLLVLLAAVHGTGRAQEPAVPADSAILRQLAEVSIEPADTIPAGFFRLVDELGINSHTLRLITRFNTIPEEIVLQALAETNRQVDFQHPNAFVVSRAIALLCERDTLWSAFFSDVQSQIREPNILRFSFRDDQRWKSYALNDLFYSTFFQELLLITGNIGIQYSRDGKQWLEGWPTSMRWKFREFVFEYMPEELRIDVVDLRRRSGAIPEESSTLRLRPRRPLLPPAASDSTEPPHAIPRLIP